MGDAGIGRLPEQIPAKQQPGCNLLGFKMGDDLRPCEWRVRADGDREAEPAWLRVRRRFRQEEEILETRQSLPQRAEVAVSRLDEMRQLGHLRKSDGRLHVSHFEVIADVRVRILVIVPAGQFAQLPLETLSTGIVFTRLAPTVPAPIAERLDQSFQERFSVRTQPPSPVVMW